MEEMASFLLFNRRAVGSDPMPGPVCGVSNIADAERKCLAHKHLFVGNSSREASFLVDEAFAITLDRRFLGMSQTTIRLTTVTAS